MTEVVGIRFKKAGKVYYFDPSGLELPAGSHAIVETARGVEYGLVIKSNTQVPDEEVVQPLKKVLRPATEEDAQEEARNQEREKEALGICEEKIAALKLPMKLVDVEITFDHNKLIFYFTSDGRVDFRELVKELAAVFRTRIELRQIGVRDEAKMLNGIGICGRPLCCATFLGDFQPVSIKMAKEQKLSLNPTKISGICGRLMCCLKYEEDVYEELNRKLPGIGDTIRTSDGTGEILSVNVLMQTVKAGVKKTENDAPTIGFYHVDEFTVIRRKKQRKGDPPLEEDLMLVAEEAFPSESAEPKKREDAPPRKKEPREPKDGEPRKPKTDAPKKKPYGNQGGEKSGEKNAERTEKTGEKGGEKGGERPKRKYEPYKKQNKQQREKRPDTRGETRPEGRPENRQREPREPQRGRTQENRQ